MSKLLKKVNLVQLMILMLFHLLMENSDNPTENESNCNNKILTKNDKYYHTLKEIVEYIGLLKRYIKYFKKKSFSIRNIDNSLLLKNNDYFYIFYNKFNIYVYLYKPKNSNYHHIYFNGMNNKNDIRIILDITKKVLFNKFHFGTIEDIIDKNCALYQVFENKIEMIHDDQEYTLIQHFNYLFKNYHDMFDNNKYCENDDENNDENNEEEKEKINLKIDGYSLGGVFSQVFVYLLLKESPERYNIEINNIESWFGGDKETFENLTQKINIQNYYNKHSILYFYNKYFQSYFNNNILINNNKNDLDNVCENIDKDFPEGIINYIYKNHLLSEILS